MKKSILAKPVLNCTLVFLICCLARIVEYFWIRTDETILAENFIHKVFGIFVLTVILVLAKLSWSSIGFTKTKIVQNVFKGLALGAACFSVAYLAECILLYFMNGNVQLSVYTSGFSLNGEAVKQSGLGFIVLCISFNLINVWMEEGIFRGLFARLLSDKMSFKGIVFFSALLFGVWHWVMPMRDFIEGNSSIGNLLVMGIGYIILSGIMSIKWSILYKMTGSLWMGLGDHLFNNVVVTNLLHVISNGEADSMQIVRILIGQLISFALVMIYYKKWASKDMRS
jgi:membrane protease YdiL (CAAX protease family)